MDSKNFAIGILSTTAVILLVGVVVVHTRPGPAFADGMTIVGRDYSLVVGALTNTDEELLYVINAPTNKLAVYRFDPAAKAIELLEGVDLAEMRKASRTGNSGGKAPDPKRPAQPPKGKKNP